MNEKSEAYTATHLCSKSPGGTFCLLLNQIACWDAAMPFGISTEDSFESGYAFLISMEERRRSSAMLRRYSRSLPVIFGFEETRLIIPSSSATHFWTCAKWLFSSEHSSNSSSSPPAAVYSQRCHQQLSGLRHQFGRTADPARGVESLLIE